MTVEELIEMLKTFDPDKVVFIVDDYGNFRSPQEMVREYDTFIYF